MSVNSKKVLITLLLLGFFAWSTPTLFRHALADFQSWSARQRLAAGDAEAAESLLAKSLQQVNSNPSYYYFYAKSLYAQAKEAKTSKAALDLLQQSKNAYEKAAKLNPLEGNYWFRLAQTSWWLSRFKGYEREGDEVESFFLKAQATDPNNTVFLYPLIHYYLTTGDTEKGLKFVNRLGMVDPGAYRVLKKHSRWSEELEDQFRMGLQAATTDQLVGEQARRVMVSIAVEEDDWITAAAYTEELIENSQSKVPPHLYVQLGRYYLELENKGKAGNAFLQSIKVSDDRYQMLQNLLRDFAKPRSLDLYIQLCKDTATFDADVQDKLLLLLGKAYFSHNNLDAAVQNFRTSLQKKETGEAHRYLAEIAMKKKDWETAELASQRATELEPKNAHYNLLYVRSLQTQKKYVQALEAIRRAIRYAQPPRHDFYNIQAQLYWKLGDYQAAIESWDAAHEIAPRNAHYPRQIAHAYKMLLDFSAAERYYLAALKLKPADKRLQQELKEVRRLNNK
jgi:tetratricopeptide (TPR) repeat protein